MLKKSMIALQGTLVAQALGFLAMPFLTRLYGPEQFATYQIYLTLISSVTVLASMRYEVAMVGGSDDGEARSILRLCFVLNAVASGLVFVACILVGMRGEMLPTMAGGGIWLFAASVLLSGLQQTLLYVLLREQALGVNAVAKVLQVMVFSGAGLSLATGGYAALGLVGADVLARAGVVALSAWWIVRNRRAILHGATVASVREVLHKFRDFPLLTVPGNLISVGLGALVALCMQMAFGSAILGQYALVERTVLVPAGLIGHTIAQAFTAQMAATIQSGGDARRQFRQVVCYMIALAALPCVVLMMLGPNLFALVFGESWRLSGEFAQIASVGLLTVLATTPVNMALLISGQQKRQLYWEIGRFCLVASTWMVVIATGIEPKRALTLHVVILVLSSVVYLFLADRALRLVTQENRSNRASR